MTIGAALDMILSLFILWIVIFYCWRYYRIDSLRNELFALRNELFDYAATGMISFGDPAYNMLRNVMNGIIRFPHRVSLFSITMVLVAQRISRNPGYELAQQKWTLAIHRLEEPQRAYIIQINNRLSTILAKNLTKHSPVLWVALVIHMVASAIQGLVRGTKSEQFEQQIRPAVNLIEAQALEAQES